MGSILTRHAFASTVAILIMLGALLSSCGSDSMGPESGDPPANESASRVFGPAGGSIAVTTAQGIEVTVTIPTGALGGDQLISLTSGNPAGDSWLNVELAPEGLVFFEPVKIEVTVPNGLPGTDQNLHWGSPEDPVYLPTTNDIESGSLSSEVRSFGLAVEQMIIPGMIPAPSLDPNPSGAALRRMGSNNLGAQPVDCAQLLAHAQASFDQLKASGSFRAAVTAGLESAALMIKGKCPGSEDFASMAVDFACEILTDSMQFAIDTPIDDWTELEAQIQPAARWAAFYQGLGSNVGSACPAADMLGSFISGQADDAIAFYRITLAQLDSADLRTFYDLKQELAHVYIMWGEFQTLGVQIGQDFYDRVVGASVDQLRDIGWEMARDDGEYYPLSRMSTTGFQAGRDIIGVPAPRLCDDYYTPARCTRFRLIGGFTDADIHRDLQFAGTNVQVSGVTPADSILATGTAAGLAAGDIADRPVLDCPTRGKVRLSGVLQAFTCWNDLEADQEIIVAFNTVDVLTLRRPVAGINYLATPAEIPIEALRSNTGVLPKEGGLHGVLTVRRKRTECDEGIWGPAEYEMFTAELHWKNPTLDVKVDLPPTVEPGKSVPVDVRVSVIDQHGEAAYFADIDVSLQSTGGTLGVLSGTTDSQGWLRTQLMIDSAAMIVDGATGVARMGVTVSANATSYEGVSAQATGTATLVDSSRAEATTQIARLMTTATAAGESDPKGDTVDQDYPFENHSSSIESAAAGTDSQGESASATASASVNATYVFDGRPVLTGFSASGQTSTSVIGSGSAHAASVSNLWVTVVGGPVSYKFTGSLSGLFPSASLDKRKREGGWETPKIFDTHSSSFSDSGILELGTYRIDGRCVSDQDSGSGSFSIQFDISTPAPRE